MLLRRNFYKTVKSLKHKTKVIVIFHENKIFNLCNKILNFNNGNIKQVKIIVLKSNMTALVTDGAGFIGSNLVEYLVSKKINVIVLTI